MLFGRVADVNVWRSATSHRIVMPMRAPVCCTLLFLSACVGADGKRDIATQWSAVDSLRVDAILTPLADAHQFMGAVVIVREGQVVYARGVGMADVAAGRAFTPYTPSDGGSLAKPLTAAAVWTLVNDRRIVIDTPVTTYVRAYPHAGTTVRQLITHTNGLTPYYEAFDPYFGPTDIRTTEKLLDVVRREMPRPRFTPGTRFEYSNLGFDAAALVVERLTGQSIATYFREQFFIPYGMDSSFARPGKLADFPGPRTLGYRWTDSAWTVVDVFDNEAFVGGSNVYFSTLDLARWAGAHATGSAPPFAVRSLGQKRPDIDGRPSAISELSWYCDESGERCQYSGAINAFHSLAYWDRARKSAVAMMSNSDMAPWTLISFQRDLVAAMEGREPNRTPPPMFDTVAADARGEIAGRYATPQGDTITVTLSPDGLRMQQGRGLEYDVFHVAPAAFYVPGLDYFVGYSGGANARTMHVRSMYVDFVAAQVR